MYKVMKEMSLCALCDGFTASPNPSRGCVCISYIDVSLIAHHMRVRLPGGKMY